MKTPRGTGWGDLKDQIRQSETFRKSTSMWATHGKAFKGILNEMIGPMALLTGFAAGFAIKLVAILRTSQLIGRSLDEWSKVQSLVPQFTKLTGSVAAAERTLKMAARFAKSGAFRFEDVAGAAKNFLILTRGALANKKGLDQASDAGAVAGTSMTEAASAIGALYDAASRNPQAIDSQVEQLRMMGVISSSSADQIRNLSRSGAGFAAVWALVDKNLSANKGAADALKNTIGGLNSQLENVRTENLQSIGEMFAEGRMAGLRSAINLWEAFGPVLKDILTPVAVVASGFARASEAVTKFFKENQTATAIAGALIKILLTLVTVLALKGVVDTIKLLAGLAMGLGKAASAGAVAGAAFRGLGGILALFSRQIFKALGPLGLLAIALETVLGLMGNKGTSGQGALGGMIESVTDQSAALRQRIAELKSGGGGGIGGAAETAGGALDNMEAARKNREAAAKNLANSGGNMINGGLTGAAYGAAIGAGVGSAVPVIGTAVGAIAGGVIGGGVGLFNANSQNKEAERQYQAALAAENDASGIFSVARNQMTSQPAEFLNNPGFEAQRQKALAEMDSLNAQRDQISKQRDLAAAAGQSTDQMDAALKDIAEKMKGIASKFSPEAIDREFNRQMMAADLQARGLESMANATGRSDLRDKADKQMDSLMRSGAQKRYQDAGFNPEEAATMAEREVLMAQSERQRARNPQIASTLASAGGAAGEVAGGMDQQQLDTQRRILETLTNIAPKVAQEQPYEGHKP